MYYLNNNQYMTFKILKFSFNLKKVLFELAVNCTTIQKLYSICNSACISFTICDCNVACQIQVGKLLCECKSSPKVLCAFDWPINGALELESQLNAVL